MSSFIAIGTVAYVGASLVKANAAKQAAKSQGRAADLANQAALSEKEQARADQAPWLKAGQGAIGQLSDLTKEGGDLNRRFTMADFIKDPGYDFRMSEGAKAIERSAAARGGVLGGGTLKALTRYNQDFASNEYSNSFGRWNQENNQQFNRLASIANVGQTAAGQNQQGGQAYSSAYGANVWGQGNANAGATIAAGQQYGNAIQAVGNAWTSYGAGLKK